MIPLEKNMTHKYAVLLILAVPVAVWCGCGGEDTVEDIVIIPDYGFDVSYPDVLADGATDVARDDHVMDESTVEDLNPVDIGGEIEEGAFGSPCDKNEDCLFGFCMPYIWGNICSAMCTTDCPDPSWSCEFVYLPNMDPTYVCVPGESSLCKPCTSDDGCRVVEGEETARCVSYGEEAAFCGTDCTANPEGCRPGFTCQQIEAGFSACVREEGLCPCVNQVAGMASRCTRSNEAGTCVGSRLCVRNGSNYEWGLCSVSTPSDEVCNKIDDDCNGTIDDMGTVNCGLGICAHMVQLCVDGQADECDPLEGAIEELCNGLDDNCDGNTDEDWNDKGAPCDGSDVDECMNGVWGCAEDGSGLVCEGDVASGTEECDGVDNDCDGETDEIADLGTLSCGLGICAQTVPACVDGADNECDPLNGAELVDLPDEDARDGNCDGVDGDLALAVFVDKVTGLDTNEGTRDAPLATIQAGITRASSSGATQVLVSEGVYNESLVLADGVGVYGKYERANGWRRSSTKVTQVRGSTTAVVATGLNAPTVLQGLVITSESASVLGTSSVAIQVSDSPGLLIQACTVQAGAGASGRNGPAGSVGQNGSNGSSGNTGCEYYCASDPFGTDCLGLCGSCSQPAGGSGGSGAGGANGGTGGAGGQSDLAGNPGQSGSGNLSGFGAGGVGGPNTGDGSPGGMGSSGSFGNDGLSGLAVGLFSAAGYAPADGGEGTSGTNGGGGDGGGSGGGDNPETLSTNWCGTYGSSGGGGGGGGGGGTGGSGGGGGGASIGILVTGSAIVVENTMIVTASGGNGGSGGAGGSGGNGGSGGAAGDKGDDDDQGQGAAGGNGGNGGKGGNGGGGGGGPSFGIVCVSTSYTASGAVIIAGTGGAGGSSATNPGAAGLSGESTGCL